MSERVTLTARTWWDVDILGNQEPRGAAALVKRCMRMYKWNVAFAERVLDGYRVFLDSKRFSEDWDATKLSPSLPVDQMWHAHVLDTKNYASDCALLVGNMVHHDPDGDVDEEARTGRIENMKKALAVRFNSDYDHEVWDFGEGSAEEQSRKRPRSESEADDDERVVSPSSADDPSLPTLLEPPGKPTITIGLFDMVGQKTFFKVSRSTRMDKIFAAYADMMGVSVENLRFIIKGAQLDTSIHHSVGSLRLEDQDRIHVCPKLCGC